MRIADKDIGNGAVLAPMAGITDVTFRSICKRFGASLTVSEMISAKGVYYGDKKTATLAVSDECEKPFSLQLFGSTPEIMSYAAKKLLEFNPAIDIFDVNMGCPMPKITGNGDGSALMKTPELAGRIVYALKNATNAPVTVKIRTGWDSESINAPYLAAVCEANGASAICVHGRTRSQLYAPPVDFDTIKKVKQTVKIPVIANGGVHSGEDAIRLLDKTGCDSVAIGQGAMGNPFIFEEYLAVLNGVPYTKPEAEERLKTAAKHVSLLCSDKGEYTGVREARKHLTHYIKGMAGSAEARRRINSAETEEELLCILKGLTATFGLNM